MKCRNLNVLQAFYSPFRERLLAIYVYFSVFERSSGTHSPPSGGMASLILLTRFPCWIDRSMPGWMARIAILMLHWHKPIRVKCIHLLPFLRFLRRIWAPMPIVLGSTVERWLNSALSRFSALYTRSENYFTSPRANLTRD